MKIKKNKTITIEDRMSSIINGQVQEIFANGVTVEAKVCTISGVSVFDDTNTERVATHKIIMDYLAGMTSEKWIKLGSKRIKVLTVENCCEANKIHKLMCTERGEDSQVVNQG